MILYQNSIFVHILCYMLIFKHIYMLEQCLSNDLKTIPNIGVNGSQLWSSKSQDLEQCAILCVRRKPCLSINYDIHNGLCELNSGIRNTETTIKGINLVYSEYTWWPPNLDKDCYARPCKDNEVCIPGYLLDKSSGCSYACFLAVRDVCPLPSFGVSNGRIVGSVNIYNCQKGYIGGGNATCLPSKQWDKEINTTCTPILRAPCNDKELCSLINGKCSDEGRCICGGDMKYNKLKNECETAIFGANCTSNKLCGQVNGICSVRGHCECDQNMAFNRTKNEYCGDPPIVKNATCVGNGKSVTCNCSNGYFPVSGSNDTITCTQRGWEHAGRFSCFTCGEPPVVVGATVTISGQTRQYTCNAPDYYPIPTSATGIITCNETLLIWVPEGFKCGGLRLVKEDVTNMKQLPMSGFVEMFHESVWRDITFETWTWRETKVACRKMFGLEFGGSFHKNWYDTEKQTKQSMVSKVSYGNCTGHEDSLENCSGFKLEEGERHKEMALTCYSHNITGAGNVDLTYEYNGHINITFNGTSGGLCGNGWKSTETEVACRTARQDFRRVDECTRMCGPTRITYIHANHVRCAGDEPHLFFCRNGGWGFTDCTLENLVTIQCKQ